MANEAATLDLKLLTQVFVGVKVTSTGGHVRRRKYGVARWNADLPYSASSLTELCGPTLVPSYCFPPKTGDNDILGVNLI